MFLPGGGSPRCPGNPGLWSHRRPGQVVETPVLPDERYLFRTKIGLKETRTLTLPRLMRSRQRAIGLLAASRYFARSHRERSQLPRPRGEGLERVPIVGCTTAALWTLGRGAAPGGLCSWDFAGRLGQSCCWPGSPKGAAFSLSGAPRGEAQPIRVPGSAVMAGVPWGPPGHLGTHHPQMEQAHRRFRSWRLSSLRTCSDH